ncbi:hypothetical protein BDM02DRAFT_3192234 [Thelephora ganbajun]|uniref:Uncharacterized protein n=1 Tax=Thelephora ganbajun TaxID=370292 RepID=A0ACB6Z029_THEGA|nr:hypothetical protein BDM02DRAFT_3192234 [Thelephora ganbajun]
MVAGGPCILDFSFSPEVEWALTSHQRILVILQASPFHKRQFLRVASRKARLGYSHLLLTHRLLEHPIVILPFWTAEAFDVYLREMIALPIGERAEVEDLLWLGAKGGVEAMEELELAWEQQGLQASLGYTSAVEEGVDKGVVEMQEGYVEEDEERLWFSNSSNRAVLALIPD